MQDVNHALSVLADTLGIPQLQLNADKQAGIVFTDGLSVYITEIEPGIAEMSFPLRELDHESPAIMRAMLAANCLGHGTGAGRLAIDEGNDEALYCERWDVTTMDARQIEQRFSQLSQYGLFWRTEGLELLEAEADKHEKAAVASELPGAGPDEVMLRA
ncbi:type III secretion system chaperone [Rhizobium oryzicola]|uniref:Type III secretion system chaperone n=1 Tax=Rhizobium oryzicola TaxID=1232668 RepID=A0ABT8T428_9HYPH|nr:type III secretion system chaperone [Rhizobium oryzicola]MDO1585063.1 type III secretion system chaperone [Rhizobium oryzicola]